jgi:glycosyltransferase involved in cell wall biosynthesis
MRCPAWEELPAPEASPDERAFAGTACEPDDGGRLPRITIVIPSFNQGRYIEAAIRSVLLQGYPDVELIVMDGGSSDGTVAVIRKYEPWIAYWVSAADGGQSAAINEGFRRSTGAVCAWIGCDDRYLPGTLSRVGRLFADAPDRAWLAGAGRLVFQSGRSGVMPSRVSSAADLLDFWRWGGDCFVVQPSCFWRRGLWDAAGGLRDHLHLSMDYDLWLRFAQRAALHAIDDVFSVALREAGSKTVENRERQQVETMRCAYEFVAGQSGGASALTARFLRWYAVERLRRGKEHVVQGDVGAALHEISRLIAAPARTATERGRAALLAH